MVEARSTAPAEPDIEIKVDYRTARILRAVCSMGAMQYESTGERERYLAQHTNSSTREIVSALQPISRALKDVGVG